ncbi:MAG: NAD(P)H-hydrate dehydratase [Myxococcota bacterium]
MIPLLTSEQMRSADGHTINTLGVPGRVLMETAGRACAAEVMRHLRPGGRVVVVCGTGNNGGDGLVVARVLKERGVRHSVILLGRPDDTKGDCAANLQAYRAMDGLIHTTEDEAAVIDHRPMLEGADLVVDAIFGTGLSRPVTGKAAAMIELMDVVPAPVLAVDVPSGISSDTGETLGVSVRANWTVALGAMKRGLALVPGADRAGDVRVVDIGIPTDVVTRGPGVAWGLTLDDARTLHEPRELGAHKGTGGHIAVVSGSPTMAGASVLACVGALRAGAGRVSLLWHQELAARDLPVEVTTYRCDAGRELDAAKAHRIDALAVGPGLPPDDNAQKVLAGAFIGSLPLVLDAGALAALGTDLARLKTTSGRAVLTPHPAELGRLLGIPTTEVQRDRIGAALRAADASGCVVVNKGARSVIAAPSGDVAVCLLGHPVLACGGTGDVLAGIIGALLASGRSAWDAARLGVMLHARAGERLAEQYGPQGVLATEIADEIPRVFRELETP